MDSQLNTLEQGMNEEEKVLPDSKMVNDDVKRAVKCRAINGRARCR